VSEGLPLSGRVAVVTGGSRGIGRAIVETLGRRGAAVAFCFRESETAARELQSALRAAGSRVMARRCDVKQETEVTEFLTAVASELGPVDILVNNAGLTRDAVFLFMDRARWEEVLAVNLGGAFFCTKSVVRGMMLRRWGRIINLVSPSGLMGTAGQANYSAAKAGLVGLTRALARELAPHGILANAISPGLIDTDMVRQLPEKLRAEHLAQVPLGRLGRPEEVAALAAFLASEESSYISGQVIGVDGGLL
jgi:3-oxoacyl-[acyl-carrier protein] reductase